MKDFPEEIKSEFEKLKIHIILTNKHEFFDYSTLILIVYYVCIIAYIKGTRAGIDYFG